MTFVALAVLAVLLPLVAFDLAFRPTIRRLAIRNIVRRPGEAALVVVGALLATALITASFIIGDSFGSSIRGLATDRWGPTDEVVLLPAPDDVDPAVTTLRALPPDLVDGVLGASLVEVAAGSTGPDPVVEPEVRLLELDPGEAVAFAGGAPVTGNGPLGPDEIVINQRLADDLGVGIDDELVVYLGGEPTPFRIGSVRPATGLNGLGDLIVASGSITDRLEDPGAVVTSAVLVSNVGDTFSGAELTSRAVPAIEEALDSDSAQVIAVKQDLLDDAELEAAEMTELFGTIGGFSVAAGILLVVNLFVMLAGERKGEMGTLRAVGLRRGSLVRAFSLEGAVYGVVAAVAGVAVGVGVAAIVMRMAGDLFDGDLTIRLDVVPTSLLSGVAGSSRRPTRVPNR